MGKRRVTKKLRRIVAEAAQYRCGFCLSSELVMGVLMEVEHILPESKGGQTIEENLWLACRHCNGSKGDRIAARDPVTKKMVRLFHPRRDRWTDHFRWIDEGRRIKGLSATGRATVKALQLNRDFLVAARAIWICAGAHPPNPE